MVASAADDIAADGYCAEISGYREAGNFTAPTSPVEGEVFAGWYTDDTFTTAIAPSVTSGPAYAKFVDPAVFTIQNQFNEGAYKTSATVDRRIITTIDSEWYAGVEFTFTCAGVGTTTLPINIVYTSLVGYTPDGAFCEDSAYFAVEKITGIPKDVYTSEMSITPKYTTYDGTVITGTTRGTEEEPLVLKNKLELGTTVLSVDSRSDATWLVMNWGEVTDELPNGAIWGTSEGTWLDGGVYVNNASEPSWVMLYKNGCHYMLFSDMGWTITEGTRISIRGTYQHRDGSQIKIEPVTFQYNNGTWSKLSAEELEIVTLSFTGDTDPSRKGAKNLFFTLSQGDDLKIYDMYGTVWAEIYRNGTERINLQLVHWASNQYYIIFGAEQPVGTTISIQGTLTDQYVGGTGNTVTFWPTTFTLREGGVWEITSTEPIVPTE